MAALILAVFAAAPPSGPAEALLARLKTFDLVRVEADVTPRAGGLAVKARLTLELLRPGPHRMLLSGRVEGLEARRDGQPFPAEHGLFGLEGVLRRLAPRGASVPKLLTLRPGLPGGRTAMLFLSYTWRPDGDWAYAGAEAVDTQLDGIWLPGMLRERFDSVVRVNGGLSALAPGRRREDGAFEARGTQVVPLVAGSFPRQAREGRFAVWLPEGVDEDPAALLADVAAVHERIEARFGPAGREGALPFTLVVDRALRPAPSYCAGTFAVVRRHALPSAAGRARWLQHLAHEVAHRWWGHAVATPLLGRGGTWLREGLAEWSGLSVTGELAGAEAERRIGRALFGAYLRRADLRRRGPRIFANEATLEHATYLDPASVPYWRGALVFRLLDHRDRDGFRAALRAWAGRDGGDLEDFAALLPERLRPLLDYYVRGTPVPDLRLERDGNRYRVTCADPDWPGGPVPVVADGEPATAIPGEWRTADRVQVDPERIWLDPVVSNNTG